MAAKATAAMKTTTNVSNPMLSKLCTDLSDKSLQNARPEKRQEKNKDLQKTRMCTYFLQGKCTLDHRCKFAHDQSEIRQAPNLHKTGLCANFMKGNCKRDNCTFAHGEAELVKPPSHKKAMCIWYRQGSCRNGKDCGFVHELAEVIAEVAHTTAVPSPVDHATPVPSPSRKVSLLSTPVDLRPKPWAKPRVSATVVDDDASTDAPSESHAETVSTDVSSDEAKPMPDEHLFRVMAGRGSAPQDQQVKSMSLAIEQLKAKLSQLKARQEAAAVSDRAEGETLRNQIKELEYAINKLSKQIQRTEAGLRGDPVALWRNGIISRDEFLAAEKVAGSDVRPVKVRAKVPAKRSDQGGKRMLVGAFVLAAMVLVEMYLPLVDSMLG